MTGHRDESTPIQETFPKFLTDKGKGTGGTDGAYRRDAERELDRFLNWARGNTPDPANASPASSWTGIIPADTPGDTSRDVRFSDLNARIFGDYARYLVASGFANSTVRTYYTYIASWCGWAEGQGYLPRHYARESDAEDPLPNDDGRRPGDQQAWSPEQRDLLTRYVDEQTDAAFDALGEIEVPHDERGDLTSDTFREKMYARFDAIKRGRELALAYLLCYAALRASEFLDAPNDDRPGRNGLRWEDISIRDKNATVFRKKQQWDEASLPNPVLGPLRRYHQLLDPPENWPVSRRSTGQRMQKPSLPASVS
jgi:hypothetical protein